MSKQIYTCFWSDSQAKEMADYYCSIFKNSKITAENPMVVNFELNETKFMTLNGGPKYKFSPASSYVIECDTQEEIDHYWEKLGEGGLYNQCGWLDDKFGVSWQIVYSGLGELISNKNHKKSEKVMKAMLQMKKLDIKTLEKAAGKN